MASFAKLNSNNIVERVESVVNEVIKDSNGVEQEAIGIQFLKTLYNEPNTIWKQSSYNTNGGVHSNGGTPFRKNHAGIGYTWDEDDQIFWPKKPFTSWVKHIPTASWKSPIGDAPALTEEQTAQNTANTHRWGYNWNEANQSWDLVNSKVS